MPNNLISWFWWIFSTIFMALLINIISAYLKPKIDDALEKYSNTRKELNEKEENEILGLASEMLESIEHASFGYFNFFRWQILSSSTDTWMTIVLGVVIIASLLPTTSTPFTTSPDPRTIFFFLQISILLICAILLWFLRLSVSRKARKFRRVIGRYKQMLDNKYKNKM